MRLGGLESKDSEAGGVGRGVEGVLSFLSWEGLKWRRHEQVELSNNRAPKNRKAYLLALFSSPPCVHRACGIRRICLLLEALRKTACECAETVNAVIERSGRLCLMGSSTPPHSFSSGLVRRTQPERHSCVAEISFYCDLEAQNAMRIRRPRARIFRFNVRVRHSSLFLR